MLLTRTEEYHHEAKWLPAQILLAKRPPKIVCQILTAKGFDMFLWARKGCLLGKAP
jgi:hypothetical protein